MKQQDFLQNIDRIVSKGIEDYNFCVDDLARQIHVSRRQIYRIFQQYLDCSPGEFIREKRLQYGFRLWKKQRIINLHQLTELTGFRDPRHFQRLFAQRYGIKLSCRTNSNTN